MIRTMWLAAAAIWSAHAAANGCPDLSSETRDQVLRLARFQYKLNQVVHLTVESEPLPGCFYQVRLRSAPPSEGFVKVFTVTPDQAYVVSDAVDLRNDPAEEARKKNKAFGLKLSPAIAPVRGNKDAPVTVVIFSDFQCPFCRQAANILNAQWAADNGEAKLVFRHFPLPMHGWARSAAEASVCAARQDGEFFWTVHDFLFQHQAQISGSILVEEIEKQFHDTPKFDQSVFRQCVESGAAKKLVQADVDFGLENKVDATPTVFINGVRVNWVANPDQVRSLVRQAARAAATDDLRSTASAQSSAK